MATIRLKHLEIGSTLSEDVKDLNGRMLLSAGSEITDKHLKIFRTWGITEVSIVGGDGLDDEEIDLTDVDPDLMKKVEQKIDDSFIHCNKTHPANHELINYIKLKTLREHLS